MENLVKILIKFGHNTAAYRGYEAWHGKLAEVEVSEDKTWEDVLLNDFGAQFDWDQFVVQGLTTTDAKKHSLEESIVELLQECEPSKKDGIYRIYVVFKNNFKKKPQVAKRAQSMPTTSSSWKNTRPTARQQSSIRNKEIRVHNVRTIARDPLAVETEEVDIDDYNEPLLQDDFLHERDTRNYNYMEIVHDDDDDDTESVLSQHSQFEERKMVPSRSRPSQEAAIPDLREVIKERVDNFGRRNLLQIREELLGVMKKDGQYSKWGLVAPSATFFLEQIFQLRGYKNGY